MRLILVISLLVSTSLYATEVYRSVDENGRVVFTNKKPSDDNKHEIVDVEVKNKLGSKVEPSGDTRYYRFDPSFNPSRPQAAKKKRYTNPYSYNKPKKEDMRDLQENCERYRNIVRGNNKHKQKRDYWCGRLHRGK